MLPFCVSIFKRALEPVTAYAIRPSPDIAADVIPSEALVRERLPDPSGRMKKSCCEFAVPERNMIVEPSELISGLVSVAFGGPSTLPLPLASAM